MGTIILLSDGVDILGVAPSPEYITSGDYRSSAPGGSAKGPSSRLTVALVLVTRKGADFGGEPATKTSKETSRSPRGSDGEDF